jgi:microcystin degradation protein MlrC
MKSLETAARRIESENPDILAVNVHAGFSFADMPEAGVSFTAIMVGDPAVAQAELKRLGQLAIDSKQAGNVVEPPLEDVLAKVRSLQEGPIILVEPSDNIGGGAPGDGTGVLRALVQHHIQNAAVAINDPEAVAALSALEPGARATLSIGGKGSTLSGGPITLDVELVSKSKGHFDLEDAHSHLASIVGARFDMGPCAVVRHE